MDSTNTNVDLELLAAFADGRLSGEERIRAVKLLASSDEALEIFANTLQDLPIPEVKVVPITSARRWRHWKVMVPVAAAAVLATVMVPRLTGSNDRGSLGNEYAMELAADPGFAGGLRQGWQERQWAVTRGGSSREGSGSPRAGSPMESKLAFRLGVRSVDLQIALRRGDTTLSKLLTTEVLETLKGIQFSEPVAASYTELSSGLPTESLAKSIDRASAAERELRDLLGSPSFVFGQWVGAAELAAQTRNAPFFQSEHGTGFIRTEMPANSLADEDVEALRLIDARISQVPTKGALDDVRAALQEIIRRRGS